MTRSRVELVRAAYERFEAQDIDGVLELLAPDVEWPDMVHDDVLRGHEALRDYWTRQFEVATPTAIAGEVIEMGDHVVAVVYQQVYERNGGPFGPPTVVVHRFSFRDGRIAAMELTTVDEIPDYVRQRFRG